MTTGNTAIMRAVAVAAAGQSLTEFEFVGLVEEAMKGGDCSVFVEWTGYHESCDGSADETGVYGAVTFSCPWLRFDCSLRVKTQEDRERICAEMAKKAHAITVISRPGYY